MKRAICLVLIIVLTVCLSYCLFACNNDETKKDTRAIEVSNFKEAYLKVCDDDWNYSLSQTQVEALANEGHYIYQKAIADIYGEALYNSNVREQKIKSITTKLLADVAFKNAVRRDQMNSEKLLGIVEEIGLTGQDISNLILSGFKAWIEKGYGKVNGAYDKIENRIKNYGEVSENKKGELNEALLKAKNLSSDLKLLNEDKKNLTNSISKINADFSTLIEFAYNSKDIFLTTSNLDFAYNFEAIGQKETNEVNTYLQGVLAALSNLRTKLTDAKIESLASGLKQIKDAVAEIYVGGNLFNSFKTIVNISFIVTNMLPVLSDIVLSSKEVITSKTVGYFLNTYSGNYSVENYALVIGKVLNEIMTKISLADLKSNIKNTLSVMDNEAVAYLGVASIAMVRNLKLKESKEYYLTTNDTNLLTTLGNYFLMKNTNIASVQHFLRAYKLDPKTNITIINNVTWAKGLKSDILNDELNPNGAGREILENLELLEEGGAPKKENVEEWFDKVLRAMNTFVEDRLDYAKQTIENVQNKLLDDFYDAKSIYFRLNEIFDSLTAPLTSESANYAEVQTLYESGDIGFILNILGLN